MSAGEIRRRITAVLPDALVELVAFQADDDHWEAVVTSARFEGLSRVQQHRLVYDAIGPDMGGALHALRVVTKLPAGDTERT